MEDKRGAYCRCLLALVLAWAGVSRLQGFAQTAETSNKSVRNRLAVTPAVGLTKTQQTTQAGILGSYGRLPLSFEANEGQTDGRVKFLSRGSGYTLFLTSTDAVLPFRKPTSPSNRARGKGLAVLPAANESISSNDALRLKLVGANPKPVIAGAEELPGKSNYFIGNDPKKWRTNVPTYAKVKYENVYPGVDLVYYGNQGQLEYDFVVAPSADPRSIRLGFAGVRRVQIDRKTGDLLVRTGKAFVRFKKPLVYQTAINNGPQTTDRALVEGHYKLTGRNRVAFEVGSYDRTKPLVIDPALSYSTYLGGSGTDVGEAIAVDSSGDAYVTGYTTSVDFPVTPGAFQSTLVGGEDAFVTKLNSTGSALVYSTYLGSSYQSIALGIAVDASANAYVTGETYSPDFPTTPGAFQTMCGGGCSGGTSDAFITKLNATGSALIYSTYLGGSSSDEGSALAVDSMGNAYATGDTYSSDFPTTAGAFQQTYSGVSDGFVTEINPAGSALVYSTYLGGTNYDFPNGIALDPSGDTYVTGETSSTNFPTTPSAFQPAYAGGVYDLFVTKLSAGGSALVYSTYLGGSGYEYGGFGIALDSSLDAYVTGQTESSDFPVTPGAFQTICNGGSNCAKYGDAVVTELSPTGAALVYSTYLGGSSYDQGSGIAVDNLDHAYVVGSTGSADFPITPGAFQTANGGAFVTELNPAGSALVYATNFVANFSPAGNGIALDSSGDVFLTGSTYSTDFPITPGAFQTTCADACGNGVISDAFVTKFGSGDQVWPLSLNFGNQPVGTSSAPQNTTLTNSGTTVLNITSISITGTNSGDFSETNTCGTSLAAGASCTVSVTFTPTAAGTRTAAVTIADDAPNSPQTASLTGTGTQPAVTLSPTSLTFPTQVVFTTSKARSVTLTNTGTGTLTITSIAMTGQFSQTNTCGTSVAPGARCAISVTFKPKSKGTLTGAVTVTDNAPGSPQKVTLSGCGTYIQFSTPTLNFGNQPVGTKSPAKKVTVTNKGSAAVSITSISIGGSNAGDFAETNTCGSSLASGANCSISVTFTPAKQGKRSGEISINDNGGCSPQMVAVSGTGTP